MRISVIIPAYNEEKYLERTLKALNSQSIPRKDFEIIVCNDASTDNTRFIAEKYAEKVLNLKKSSTISQVRNKGAKKARGDILVFLDADTIAPKNLLDDVLRNCTKNNYCIPRNHVSDSLIVKLFYKINYLILKMFPEIGIVSGCCFAIPKKAFQKVSGFNEDYKICEDIDLHLRLLNNGYNFVLLNSTVKTSDRKLKKMGVMNMIRNNFFQPLIKNPKNSDYYYIR